MKSFAQRLSEAVDEADKKKKAKANGDGEDRPAPPEPKAKTDAELAENPADAVNQDEAEREGEKKMSADPTITQENRLAHEMNMTPGQARATWDGVTGGATHKITACMEQMKGKVDDPAAFCNYLAQQVGYTPER